MNDRIARISNIDAKIKCIDKIIKDQSWKAAGLTVAIKIGPLDEYHSYDVVGELGIASMDEGYSVLNAFRQGLQMSLAYNVESLKREHAALSKFLEEWV
jgi:hypothetical protein